MRVDKIGINKYYRNNPDVRAVDIGDNKNAKKWRKMFRKSLSEIDNNYWQLILEMLNCAKLFTQSEKNEFVEIITEDYHKEAGQAMKSQMLQALGDFILDEVLSDKDVDKMANTEYPMLSVRQQEKRNRRETAVDGEILEFLSIGKSGKRTMQEKGD